MVVHIKKKIVYYPQENDLVEGTNETIQTILRKTINEHWSYWDQMLRSALWVWSVTRLFSIPPPLS